MDRITAQISELSEAERFQLLIRLSRAVPNSAFQSNLSAVRGRRDTHRDIRILDYSLISPPQEQPVG